MHRHGEMPYSEAALSRLGYTRIAALDEAGRGPLAGPVVAAAVVLPRGWVIEGVRDSKQLTPSRREVLYREILAQAVAYGIGVIDNEEIDRVNILQATRRAMYQAVQALGGPTDFLLPDFLLIDALELPGLNLPQLAVVKGDRLCPAISAASILAKVTRDHLMEDFHRTYPQYDFTSHKGYGTLEHLRRLKALFLTAALWVMGFAASPGLGQSPPNASLKQSQKSLDQLNRQLQKAREKKKAKDGQERSILGQLERFDRQLQLKRRELKQIEGKVRQVDHEIKGLEVQITSLRSTADTRRQWVRERLRTIYKEGRFPYLQVLMSSRSYHDFLKKSAYLEQVVRKEADVLSHYEASVSDLARQEPVLKGKKSELLDFRRQLERKLAEVGEQKQKKGRLLARIRSEKTTQGQAIRELERSSREMEALIRDLEKKRLRAARSKGGKRSGSAAGFKKVQGHLNWPADGDLVSRFGLQRHPKFDSDVYHSGIEIGSLRKTDVRSVYEGKVAYADWFPGYGMVIIVEHGENYYTLYAHLAKLLVAMGDSIKRNQLIGQVGDTGVSQGDRLYFELRRGEEPVDPLAWLKAKP